MGTQRSGRGKKEIRAGTVFGCICWHQPGEDENLVKWVKGFIGSHIEGTCIEWMDQYAGEMAGIDDAKRAPGVHRRFEKDHSSLNAGKLPVLIGFRGSSVSRIR